MGTATSPRSENQNEVVADVSPLCHRRTPQHLPGLLHHTLICCWQYWHWRMPKELFCPLSSGELRLHHNLHLHPHCLVWEFHVDNEDLCRVLSLARPEVELTIDRQHFCEP